MPSRSQAPITAGSIGQRRLVEHDGEVGVLGQLVAHRAERRRGSGRAASGCRARRRAAPRRGSSSGAVSERMSASRARSPRASITAMPWSPIVPDTSTTSPGCTSSGPSDAPGGDHADAGGRDVEAVGRAPVRRPWCRRSRSRTPAAAAASAMSATMSRSSATAKPSSITNAAESHGGRAPSTATSLTVPCTAR